MWAMVEFRKEMISDQWGSSPQFSVREVKPYSRIDNQFYIQRTGIANFSPPLKTIEDRIHYVFFRAILFYGSVGNISGMLLDFPFIIMGIIVIFKKTIVDWMKMKASPDFLHAVSFILIYISMSFMLPHDWDRYYLILIPSATFLSGLGIAYSLKIIWYQTKKRFS